MQLYRAMKKDHSLDKPKIGNSARELGVRVTGEFLDIKLVKGNILPDDGGLSVSPESPENLPAHRRKRDPIWEIHSEILLNLGLQYIEDKPGKHGLIKPLRKMSLSEYEEALFQTQQYWELVE
ncbi:conserved hypothetical protein [Beggiatoa sp. PS]|nr:conserved hypothetical protein [Beggiatoa sp. PS]